MSEEVNQTIFGKIIRGELDADKVFEDDDFLAFRDINPAAPVHILIIPKKHIVNLLETSGNDGPILGEMMVLAGKIAKAEGLEESGFRFVINNGAGVGQSVFHIHGHILGGRDFSWPPG